MACSVVNPPVWKMAFLGDGKSWPQVSAKYFRLDSTFWTLYLWFYTSILFLMSFIDVTCRCCHSLAASHHQKHHANSTTILWPMALPSSEVLPGLLWVACLCCVFPESTPLWHAQAQHDLFLHGCNIMRWNRKFHKLKTARSDRFHHALSLWVCLFQNCLLRFLGLV